MYTFRQSNSTINYSKGKIYDTLDTKYFMLIEPQNEKGDTVFARKLGENEMEGEDKLYPDGYITFNNEEYPDEVTRRIEGTNDYNFLSDVFDVSYDPKTEFSITKNQIADIIMRLNLDCDKIECEVVDYQLYYSENEFMSAPMEVNESEFRSFIKAHGKDFDIIDNKLAQVPGVGMI